MTICLAFLFVLPVSAATNIGKAWDGSDQADEILPALVVGQTQRADTADELHSTTTTWRRFGGKYYINLASPSYTFWFPIGPIVVPGNTRSLLFKLYSPRRADFNLLVSYDGYDYEAPNKGRGGIDSLKLRVSPGKEFWMYVQCIRGHGTAYLKLWRR
jgi:hypothetical protein